MIQKAVLILSMAVCSCAHTTIVQQKSAHGTQATSDAAVELHAIYEEFFELLMQRYPMWATSVGDHRYNDRLCERSFEAIADQKRTIRKTLERAMKIDCAKLRGTNAVSCELLIYSLEWEVTGHKFPFELAPVSMREGIHLALPNMVRITPFSKVNDYENYLKRLEALPRIVDQEIELMKAGLKQGWVCPQATMKPVPDHIEALCTEDFSKSPFYGPFKRWPDSIGEQERKGLEDRAKKILQAKVFPALKKQRKFLVEEYIPKAPTTPGLSALPQGEACYRLLTEYHTTTKLTPKEIHELGKKEVARIRGEMVKIIKEVGFKGSLDEFFTFLRTDKRFYYENAEDMIRDYRDLAKRVDAMLPAFFAELPRNPYGIEAMPEHAAKSGNIAQCINGTADGSRAGRVEINTHNLKVRPKYRMVAVLLHEAVPGHHLQFARARELKALPALRREMNYSAYAEGWALYSEGLGEEMGLYKDPYMKFGRLEMERFRACRLVVDTGIHALGWSRQQAIDYLKKNTSMGEPEIEVEVDRYITIPGQALSYKIGHLP